MFTTQIIGQRISRHGWGVILFGAAIFAIIAAFVLQALGLGNESSGPLAFVLTVVCIKLGCFVFWPVIVARGSEASTLIRTSFRHSLDKHEKTSRDRRQRKLQLWDDNDPRVDVASFSANLPAFILTHEQRFLDWNPAFDLIFGNLPGLKRGVHIKKWYTHLDNFRRVSKRTEKLFGEAILPITDRERICFASQVFGRMVFTRIMSPIIDRESGRTVGWNVVLNINSVTRREAFFEKLFATITMETNRSRYVASWDALVNRCAPYKHLVTLHARQVRNSYRVIAIGAQTGELTSLLLEDERRRITTVDECTYALRKLRSKCAKDGKRLHLVRRSLNDLEALPEQKFDGAVLTLALHKIQNFSSLAAAIYRSLQPGAAFSVSFLMPSAGLEGLYTVIRQNLDHEQHFDALKHQFAHALEYEQQGKTALPFQFRTREQVIRALVEVGFTIEAEHTNLLDGKAIMLVARKSLG